ncbi:unnamed protein product [Cuscuta europaea]|uniref:Retrotransposon gag domain-containing protein n=1 Tax=Cuscuta europaea TaxID=41803 RepID=A0A9P0Z7G7_CUSEU|nr:unnamed protein product [Cuscuta europaea]
MTWPQMVAEQVLINQKLEAQGIQLAEIAASLVALTKALAPPTAEEHSSTVASLDVAATSSFGTGLCNTSLMTLQSFDREDQIGWVDRAEQQFKPNWTLPGNKVAAVVVAMEGSAVYNFEITHVLMAHFDSRFKGKCFEWLSGVKQTRTMEEYISIFVQLTIHVSRLSDDHYLGYFMSGMKMLSDSFPKDTGQPRGHMRAGFRISTLRTRLFRRRMD